MDKKHTLNTDISMDGYDFLEDEKKKGNSKGTTVDKGLAFLRCILYSNNNDLETETQEVHWLRFLKNLREKFAEQGADLSVIAGLDKSISFQKQVLTDFEKSKNGKKGTKP